MTNPPPTLQRCYIDEYCNNDVLSMIFQYVGGFELLTTIPFVCSKWRTLANKTPLHFNPIHGWVWSFIANKENTLAHLYPTEISIIAR